MEHLHWEGIRPYVRARCKLTNASCACVSFAKVRIANRSARFALKFLRKRWGEVIIILTGPSGTHAEGSWSRTGPYWGSVGVRFSHAWERSLWLPDPTSAKVLPDNTYYPMGTPRIYQCPSWEITIPIMPLRRRSRYIPVYVPAAYRNEFARRIRIFNSSSRFDYPESEPQLLPCTKCSLFILVYIWFATPTICHLTLQEMALVGLWFAGSRRMRQLRLKTELKERIISASDEITDDMQEATSRDYERRLHKCLKV